MEKIILELLKLLDDLAKKESQEKRESIAELCHQLLTNEFSSYTLTLPEIQDAVDELGIIDELPGRAENKEPKILHMTQQEIMTLRENMRQAIMKEQLHWYTHDAVHKNFDDIFRKITDLKDHELATLCLQELVQSGDVKKTFCQQHQQDEYEEISWWDREHGKA